MKISINNQQLKHLIASKAIDFDKDQLASMLLEVLEGEAPAEPVTKDVKKPVNARNGFKLYSDEDIEKIRQELKDRNINLNKYCEEKGLKYSTIFVRLNRIYKKDRKPILPDNERCFEEYKRPTRKHNSNENTLLTPEDKQNVKDIMHTNNMYLSSKYPQVQEFELDADILEAFLKDWKNGRYNTMSDAYKIGERYGISQELVKRIVYNHPKPLPKYK